MRKYLTLGAISLSALTLAGCTPGNNVGGATVAGVATGGLIGGALFQNTAAGVFVGALIGGVIGHEIGRYMDEQDRMNMQSAIVDTPVDEESRWTNERTHVTYIVRPVRQYQYEGRHCRDYRTTVIIDGKPRTAFGKACRQANGQWRIVS